MQRKIFLRQKRDFSFWACLDGTLCLTSVSVWRQSNCHQTTRGLRKGKFHSSSLLIKNWNAPLIKTFLELPFIPRRCSMSRFWWRMKKVFHLLLDLILRFNDVLQTIQFFKNFSYYEKCHKIEREHTFGWEILMTLFVWWKLLFLSLAISGGKYITLRYFDILHVCLKCKFSITHVVIILSQVKWGEWNFCWALKCVLKAFTFI